MLVPSAAAAAATDLPWLEALARRFPSRAATLAEMAHLQALLTLPRGTIHIVSDVHGEHKKLSHVIRNASGGLRVLIDALFADLSDDERSLTLRTVYYCEATWSYLELDSADEHTRDDFFFTMLKRLLTVARTLASTWSDRAVERVFPVAYRELFRSLFAVSAGTRPDVDGRFLRALVEPFLSRGQGKELLRLISRVVRNLSVYELIVAGDLGDRGPRLDKVIDVLSKQPRLAIAWGNHDVSWMGACLGHRALIATVVRLSLRYGRTQQLEEGYGIPLVPLASLARRVYGTDPDHPTWRIKTDVVGRDPHMMGGDVSPPTPQETRLVDKPQSGFLSEAHVIGGDVSPPTPQETRLVDKPQGGFLSEAQLLARMQKAIAVIQWKLEGQVIANNPHFAMNDRRLLRAIDLDNGTITIDGVAHPLVDTALPTIDQNNPEALTPEEQQCIEALRSSFMASSVLWKQMQLIQTRGSMLLRRDTALVFHGCVPVDDDGAALTLPIDGEDVGGPAMFQAFDRVVHRAFRQHTTSDLDWLWYLWTGPKSPLFGKDKMATLESHLVADEHARHETKGAYFRLVHDVGFCDRLLTMFGVDPSTGLIVNGHMPVKVEKGEEPLKRSGKAVTIDGAFSEAYGDKGFTLIVDANRIAIAEHHHFESVEDAVKAGGDIVPVVKDLRRWASPRLVGDTEAGDAIRRELQALAALVEAFEDNRLIAID